MAAASDGGRRLFFHFTPTAVPSRLSSVANQFSFEVSHRSPRSGARRGRLVTRRGIVDTPTFMPVGTVGTVKGLDVERVAQTGAQIILGNTYHLALRPGAHVVASLGGLHKFAGWERPILTDSGGFQVYSLAQRVEITEAGATFQSHIDGRRIDLTPEEAMRIQQQLGSDIAMQLDHVVGLPASRDAIADAMERSVRWAARCKDVTDPTFQTLFAIVQGGLEEDLRVASAQQLVELDFPGYAIGGLSVGEPPDEMYAAIEITAPLLPPGRPRYLMGVGRPQDLLEAIHRGIDMFDCVMPTRNGRNALAFTDSGPLRLRNRIHETNPQPIDPDCPCLACRHSKGYLRHLFQAGEMLGPILLSHHNLTYYQRLMEQARDAIEQGTFAEYRSQKLSGWAAAEA